MPYSSRKAFGLSFIFTVALSFLLAGSSFAAKSMFNTSGADQSFTAGYSERTFADSFHRESGEPLELDKGWDQWRIFKGINVSGTYDSNIYSRRVDEIDDFIVAYTPTIGIARKGEKVYFDTFYDLSYVQYTDNEKESRFNQSLTTDLGREFGKLKVDVSNNFRPDSAYNTGERTELRSAEAARVITYADTLSADLTYEFSPKTTWRYHQGLSVLYFPTGQNSQSVNRISSRTWTFSPSVSYKLTPKISLNGRYSYETVNFFEGGIFDSDSHAFGVGISGKLAPKTTLSLDGGYRTRSYDQVTLNGDEDFEFRAAVSQKLTEKMLVTLWGARTLGQNYDLTQSNTANEIKDFAGANLTVKCTTRLALDGGVSVGRSERDGEVAFRHVDNSRATQIDQVVNDYYEGNASLNWSPRDFLAFALGYKYFNKQSSFEHFQYDDHKVLGSVRVTF